jgi:tRNA nucleotidyltransferase/poly(A) polymerase
MSADPAPLEALRLLQDGAWLVGGAVRDLLLARDTADYDVAVAGDARGVARSLGRALDAHVFELSEGFGAWRVVARDHGWQIDVLPLAGGGIEADLGQRDLTINAIAQSLGEGVVIDPFGGRADLAARRLVMVSESAFAADPLRVLRVVRFACELGFTVDPPTRDAAAAAAPALAGVAPERVFAELKRIIASDAAVEGLDRLDDLGSTAVVLPELAALRGVDQSVYHDLDVYGHTRAALAAAMDLQHRPEHWFGECGGELDAFMREPLANELSRWQAMRFGVLLHDIAKPQTRSVTAEGRTTFMAHDVLGADVAAALLARLRASQRLCEHVAALTRHHLRLGFLVHEAPLSRRAVYRYLQACEPVEVDVTVLSVADRLATQGRNAPLAIERHLDLARQMLADALRWRAERPRPPLRGDELTRELGVRPGPRLGAILRELEQAAYAGEIASREQALHRARELVHGGA